MENLCPLLFLAPDARLVASGYDAGHLCGATEPPSGVDRRQQLTLCLSGQYGMCSRYEAFLAARIEGGRTEPLPAPFVSTRLVIEPTTAWRALASRGRSPLPRRWYGPLALLAVLVLGFVLTASGMVRWPWASGPGTGQPRSSLAASATPNLSPPSSPVASVEPTGSPALTPTGLPASTPLTYVVQAGDTLNAIAARFGTTVAAIKAANGLSGDLINIGQVLIIPQP